MKKASSSSSPLSVVAMAAVAVAWASTVLPRATEATIESTCAAAAARDRRVDAGFCARQFLSYHGAAESDLWMLARTAALIGVTLADDAVYDVREGAIIPAPAPAPPAAGGGGGDDRGGNGKAAAAMRACARAYDAVGMAFAEAADEVGARRFEEARQRFGRVLPLVRRCDAAVKVAGGAATPPALVRYRDECRQMAVIGVAITNLIK